MEALGIRNDHKSDEAIGRAIKVCISNNISLKQNFQRVFRFNGEEIFVDWHISTLACYLIIINADPSNRRVANAQLYFALKKNSW